MTWNYRVVKAQWEDEVWYSIREVYYHGPGGIVKAMSENGMSPGGETIEELKKDLQYMLKALEEPVLEELP